MPKFRIPYTFMEWGYVDIEASNIEEAERQVLEDPDVTLAGLRAESEYIDDSLQIDKESAAYGRLIEEEGKLPHVIKEGGEKT